MWEKIKEILQVVFSPESYIPHGHCYLWQTPLVGLHITSDFLIAIAYFSIPAALIYFVAKRQDTPFSALFALFGAFIVLCGVGHLLDIWTLWHPAYWLSGVERAATALVSCYTAMQVIELLPSFLSLKSPEELAAVNRSLEQEILDRKRAEASLERAYAELEQRVQERTIELSQANEELQKTLLTLKSTQTNLIQAEKMSSLGQLVAGVAHEINNPVSFIHGNLFHVNEYVQNIQGILRLYGDAVPQPPPQLAQRIEDIDLPFVLKDLPKLLTSMRSGTERIMRIVQSLRTFSRMDEAECKEVDLHAGLNSALVILKHRLGQENGITVERNYGELPLIFCYAGQLNQVFMNLLANAIDAIQERRETSTIEAWQANPGLISITTECDDQGVTIQISDNGLGISDKNHQNLFNPFFTTKPVGKGTGLGLSIAYQVVTKQHGGQITYHSVLGEGTKFVIFIPYLNKT